LEKVIKKEVEKTIKEYNDTIQILHKKRWTLYQNNFYLFAVSLLRGGFTDDTDGESG